MALPVFIVCDCSGITWFYRNEVLPLVLFWALGQLFTAVWLFLTKHHVFGIVLSAGCIWAFALLCFTDGYRSADYDINGKAVTVVSCPFYSPDGGGMVTVYEPVINGVLAKREYSRLMSIPNSVPLSEFITAEETENGYSLVFTYDSKALIFTHNEETGEWTESNENIN